MAELTNFISAQLPCHPAGLHSSRRGRCRESSESSDGEIISPEVNGINNPSYPLGHKAMDRFILQQKRSG